MKHLLLICLILASGYVFGQDKKIIVKDSIADRDTFNTSRPINTELTAYLSKPYDMLYAVPATGRLILDCRKTISKKPYWHGSKNFYTSNFSCTKDKCAFAVANNKNLKGWLPEDETIEVYSAVREPEFGKNDFIGQSSTGIIKRFGDTYIKKNGYIVYSDYNGKLLILYAPAGKVTFYRFVWMNRAVKSFGDIEKDILKTK